MPCPSASLAVWSSAWLAGTAASDDVLDAMTAWSPAHDVVAVDAASADALDLPTPDRAGTGLAALLVLLRQRCGPLGIDARLALPVPGDVRGVPAGGSLGGAALAAGECALLAGAGLALVPSTVADGVLRWTAHPIGAVPPSAHPSLADADHELREGVRDAASTLASMDVARHRPGVREEIAAMLRRRPHPDWPAGTPGRPLRVLQHADEVEAILLAATADPADAGNAVTAREALARSDALRPLAGAVRGARVAAVAETVRVLAPRG